MWHDLAVAFGLMLVIEGVGPFLSPASMRRILQQAALLDDAALRYIGLGSMLLGVALLYLVN